MRKYESFNVGDVVRYKKRDGRWTYGEEHIIHSAIFNQGSVEYTTNRGAWFENSSFELVLKANKKSFAALDKEDGNV